MSDRFERAVLDWYNHSRTANLEYLNLFEKPKIKLSDLENNISVIYDRLLLLSKVSIKNFHQLKDLSQSLNDKLDTFESIIKKNQSENLKSLKQISTRVHERKPLTQKEVLKLVQEIAQQPKLVEEEALKLTGELDKRIQLVEIQIHKVEKLVTEVKHFLTT